MRFYQSVLLLGLLQLSHLASAGIELFSLFTDNAVLQRDAAIPVWGTAPADSTVSVTLGGQQRSTRTDATGHWRVVFPARPLGDTLDMVVQAGAEQVLVQNLVMGDVWVCSGQSNMEWVLRNTDGADTELASPAQEHIRHFKVAPSWSRAPQNTLVAGEWHLAQGEDRAAFSAVGYYFAKRIYENTSVPIGLIGSNWGGSRIEPWMSPNALGKRPEQTQADIDERVEQARRKTASLAQRVEQIWPAALVGSLEGIEANADWSGIELDAGGWETLQAPALWEQQSFPEVDGVIWYRKTFQLTSGEAAQPLILSLGAIDDNDITWVNGVEVGSTQAYDKPRRYDVAASVLRPGINQIAVRVEDTGGGGGFHGRPEQLYVESLTGTRYSLAGFWKVKADKIVINELSNVNHVPTALYNKMIHPLFDYPVKGVIWYQGESNAGRVGDAYAYESLFQRLIHDWREGWQQPTMPFYWAQLANFNAGNGGDQGEPWAIVRAAQTQALSLPHTGQAVIIDVGDPDDIHPRDKKTVGDRLANIALHHDYGFKKMHYRGPVFKSVKQKADGLIVEFRSRKTLVNRDASAQVQGFTITNKQGETQPVMGELKANKVIITLPEKQTASFLEYAWSDNPESASLADNTGLPAEPFRVALPE